MLFFYCRHNLLWLHSLIGPDESFLNLVKCSYLNQVFWNDLTERLRQISPTEVSFTDSDPLIQRLCKSPLSEISNLSNRFESRHPTLWKCFTLAEDDTVCMILVAKFFCSSADDPPTERSGQRYVLPIILMQCNQSHVMDIDPARPDVPPLLPDSHTHMVLGEGRLPDNMGDLTSITSQVSTIHKSSYLNTLHTALVKNITVQPLDFQAALLVCERTVLSIDITPLIGSLCSHSITTLLGESNMTGCSSITPLKTEILCELLTAVLSKKSGRCCVSLQQIDNDESGVSQCGLLHSDINRAFGRYLSELGFSAVPQCPAHFWLNDRVGAGDAAATEASEVSGDLVTEDGSGSVDTGKSRGWSGSSADTNSVGQVFSHLSLSLSLSLSLPVHQSNFLLSCSPL